MSHEFDELALQRCRIHTLVGCNEFRNGCLRLERTQSLGNGLIIDRCKEKCCVELARLHVVGEGPAIRSTRVADTVFPHRIEMFRNVVGKTGEIAVQVAIAV